MLRLCERPQGGATGLYIRPLLFIMYINDVGQNVSDANMHFYADDTIIYCFGSSPTNAIVSLQKAFDMIQQAFIQLKLVLNADKTKQMLFSKPKKGPLNIPTVFTLEGSELEVVHTYKYLGILLDDTLTCKAHIENLVKKLKLKLGFLFRNKYISNLITLRNVDCYGLRSNDHLLLSVPCVRTEQGKRAFAYSARYTWNTLQKDLKIIELISLSDFKSRMSALETASQICNCFK